MKWVNCEMKKGFKHTGWWIVCGMGLGVCRGVFIGGAFAGGDLKGKIDADHAS